MLPTLLPSFVRKSFYRIDVAEVLKDDLTMLGDGAKLEVPYK